MSLGDGDDSGLSPEDAFALLGNEYRAAIIHALGDAQGVRGPRATLSFSELYDRADVDIATSQFNYHLQQLVGPFLDKTPDGYRLRHETVELYRTVLAGTYTDDAALGPTALGVDCYHCDGTIELRYADRRVAIECSDCERTYSDTTAPPHAIQTDDDSLATRVDQHLRHRILAFSKGVCPVCVNGLDTTLLDSEELAAPGTDQLDVFVHRSCDHCGAQQYMSVGLSVLYRHDVIAFFDGHGRDVTTTPIWELEFAMTDRHVRVESTDPWTVVLTLHEADDELELVLDDDMTVLEKTG